MASAVDAQRLPVLPQIGEPHPYYYRELYLPQLTSGPSSLTWGPDSRELIYSMAGSLWRQKLDSESASQLTDGPGYDYQPDWSPDGRSVLYTSYQKGCFGALDSGFIVGKGPRSDRWWRGKCRTTLVA